MITKPVVKSRSVLACLVEVSYVTGQSNISASYSFTFSFTNLIDIATGERANKVFTWSAPATMAAPTAADQIAAAMSTALAPYGVVVMRGGGGMGSFLFMLPNPVELPYIDFNLTNPNGVLHACNRCGVTNPVLDKALATYDTAVTQANTEIAAAESLIQDLETRLAAAGASSGSGGGVVLAQPCGDNGATVLSALAGVVVGQMITRGQRPIQKEDE